MVGLPVAVHSSHHAPAVVQGGHCGRTSVAAVRHDAICGLHLAGDALELSFLDSDPLRLTVVPVTRPRVPHESQ